MTCKNCGTEIADKALICFRCGQATFEAQRQPALTGEARGFLRRYYLTLLLMLLIGATWFVYARYYETPQSEPYVYTVLSVAFVSLLAWRWYLRRRFGRRMRRG